MNPIHNCMPWLNLGDPRLPTLEPRYIGPLRILLGDLKSPELYPTLRNQAKPCGQALDPFVASVPASVFPNPMASANTVLDLDRAPLPPQKSLRLPNSKCIVPSPDILPY
ncbi:hypothetical protein DSO57_1015531 [Entomophthora muscae]|uniref:Uncharacterized protein n=1 Tax=Entomophthora muscae TaxID=34485 RepID=A0ACC2RJS2_9FUNG|nr:hypothetical protein DSO57_1015531 [Entomophthora muscae]